MAVTPPLSPTYNKEKIVAVTFGAAKIPIPATPADYVEELWRKVLVSAVNAGKTIQEALDMADLARFHYASRFVADFDGLPLRESVAVAMQTREGVIGLRVAHCIDGGMRMGTIRDVHTHVTNSGIDTVLVHWDSDDVDADGGYWAAVEDLTLSNSPDPQALRDMLADAKVLETEEEKKK